MHYHRILVSAHFADMSSLLTSFISKKYFYFHLFPLVFVHYQICIFFNVTVVAVIVIVVAVAVIVIVVAVAVIEAAVGSVELQRERETHCQQCRASDRLTANAERSSS